MADKEERIFIRKGTAIELCKFIYRDGCAGEMHCCSCEISIPRSEVIERMAKALCRTYGEDCETCRFNGNEKGCKRYLEFRNYIAMAEAALNELLEGHDDEK